MVQKIYNLHKPISVSLTKKLVRQLTAEAKKRKATRSELIRHLLTWYFEGGK